MAHYEIRMEDQNGKSLVWEVEREDDQSALTSALELCRQQKMEVWDGNRRIGAVSLSGAPRLTL